MCQQLKFTKHPKKHLCAVYGCIDLRLPDRLMCGMHRNLYRKINSPYKYHYNCLKQNAKKRGIYFDLTIEQFTKFCNDTGYMELKGRGLLAYSIDRINQDLGYTDGNLQILTNYDNIMKYREYFNSQSN